jgi:hypothetical protein
LRAKRLEKAEQAADATSIVIAAAKGDQMLTNKFREFAVVAITLLISELSQLPEKQRSRLDAIQTATFSIQNIANSLKAAGVIGMPKQITDRLEAAQENGDPGFARALAQINLQVNGGSVNVSSGPLSAPKNAQSQEPKITAQDKTILSDTVS